MKTTTKRDILEYIKRQKQAQPKEIAEYFDLHPTMVHRHLSDLQEKGELIKVGSAPKVFYLATAGSKTVPGVLSVSPEINSVINKNFIYITPYGTILSGVEGFVYWVKAIKQESQIDALAKEYVETRQKNKKFLKGGLINATFKLKDTFGKSALEKLYYLDFYSLPKFGKTKLGNLVLHAKISQEKELIKKLAEQAKPAIQKIIKKHHIKAVGFIPHSVPRKIPFLVYFKQQLDLNLPEIELVKAYRGSVRVAQKSLARLEERVKNAEETIFVDDQPTGKKSVLLIDDAVGSGATLQETAKKLKDVSGKRKIYGFALVGSMKGFEVIKEI